MSLTKDWMKEDNLGKSTKPSVRAFARAISHCISSACFMVNKRGVVGAAFERAKNSMSEEELAAIQSAKGEDWNKMRER